MYLTYGEYTALYDAIDERLFNRLVIDACRILDVHTTGADNIKKLKIAFPVDESDAQMVKGCAAKLVHFFYQVNQAESALVGYESTANGLRGKVVTSVSAGNESISYSTGGATAIDAAVKDKAVRDKMSAEIVWEYLSGITDANGVNLLYMGRYPRRCLC